MAEEGIVTSPAPEVKSQSAPAQDQPPDTPEDVQPQAKQISDVTPTAGVTPKARSEAGDVQEPTSISRGSHPRRHDSDKATDARTVVSSIGRHAERKRKARSPTPGRSRHRSRSRSRRSRSRSRSYRRRRSPSIRRRRSRTPRRSTPRRNRRSSPDSRRRRSSSEFREDKRRKPTGYVHSQHPSTFKAFLLLPKGLHLPFETGGGGGGGGGTWDEGAMCIIENQPYLM